MHHSSPQPERPRRTRRRVLLRSAASSVLLTAVLLASLSLTASSADPVVSGSGFSSLSVTPAAPGQAALSQPRLPNAGGLVYADYKDVEARARALLERSLVFREDISPYRQDNSFDAIVRSFDAAVGFGVAYDDPNTSTNTLQERIDLADAELAEARDLYAFLAVFAPEARFRADGDYAARCGQPENPNPPGGGAGVVLPPVRDWCDFRARLRESVREATNIRMIFGQQFLVNALSPSFSAGSLVGGDDAVRQELANLRTAIEQYTLAETRIEEAQRRVAGDGCYVADFFGGAEWGLVAQIAKSKQLALHHRAVRESYMGITDANDIARQQARARQTYRASMREGYLKMVGLVGRPEIPRGPGCAGSAQEEQEEAEQLVGLAAEMAVELKETESKAREMAEGRNIFGFDVTYTPAQAYGGQGGLLENAENTAELAANRQAQLTTASRNYDLNQQALINEIGELNLGLGRRVDDATGCDVSGGIEGIKTCVEEHITAVSACQPTLGTGFDACMDQADDSEVKTARREMRGAWLTVEQAKEAKDNLFARIDIEKLRNVKVTSELWTGAKETAAIEAIIIAANCCSVEAFPPSVSVNPGAFVEAALRPGLIMKQAAHDMAISDADSEAVVRNLFLDLAEAQYEIDIAFQQYQTAAYSYDDAVGDLRSDLFELERQRRYLVASPANDPAYRMLRDSARMDLAELMQDGAIRTYLAARRVEYDLAARLNENDILFSDIYKARTANDLTAFLNDLKAKVSSLPGAGANDDGSFTISVARHVLGLSDRYLQGEGFTGAEIEAERLRRFRRWTSEQARGGAEIVVDFTASSDTKGLLSQIQGSSFASTWLHKVGPSDGAVVNLVTDQPGLAAGNRQRTARLVQGSKVELTSFAGCLFTYRLMPSAVMLGLDWPSSQPTDVQAATLTYGVKGADGAMGNPTDGFAGRPIASPWQVVVYLGSAPALDIAQLEDIEIAFTTTFASRTANDPRPQDCVRADF